MQQQQYYTAEQLAYLVDNLQLGQNTEHLQKLAERKMSRQSNTQYKLQDDTVRIQYFQWLLRNNINNLINIKKRFQILLNRFLIYDTYRLLQGLNNPNISQILFEQFDDEYTIIQNTAEQCIEWFYRSDNKEYCKVMLEVFDLQNDFQEAIQKKIIKDIKANHAKVYLVIKHLTSILEDSFLIQVYQNLILQYSFCYLYDFKNINNIISSIYELLK